MDASKKAITQHIQNIINNEVLNMLIPEIIDCFKEFSLSRNDFFVKKGNVCSYFCFIESGILQHAVSVSGEEKTTYLALKNSFTSSLKSFLQQTPSPKNIKALSACKLWIINISDFKHLMKHNKAFYQFYYNLVEHQIFLIDDYRIDLLTLTPEERYKKLLVNEPKLLQEVPLHYLASFLGISTRHMSRIRKNIN
ncbi:MULTISPECIES: Crp/Fnr family transcriptional regulator [Tenacibaculum]|uniref:Crp/Fnr family transcriptional regulator n=2 Tax=Tenacibaculum TaxID=104267 RepID=A0AAE9MNP2_9FLAO|nr:MULTISPECIES: Crp/Fnr family transcriptional regulator [Tenacibaculum]GFD75521.1 cAMP-binding protein [Tenacibaculum sp. KUL113]GFD78224.1 cAMP-binding protein [Tenacibaculum sp. KUL118]GFD91479.1 cAMP-binding protein [Alteromonas sp. KUL154]GFE01456.1 cAMP-binding protein [Alteromonas sp. KUL156]AZJ32956.1 Crp/Fnr family transcriptional regulator [Tenacibaculum mesophilum]